MAKNLVIDWNFKRSNPYKKGYVLTNAYGEKYRVVDVKDNKIELERVFEKQGGVK